MAMFIILSKAEADAVRGKTSPSTALDPIEMEDGTFILPDVVLTDPAHRTRKAALEPMQRKTVSEIEPILKTGSAVKA